MDQLLPRNRALRALAMLAGAAWLLLGFYLAFLHEDSPTALSPVAEAAERTSRVEGYRFDMSAKVTMPATGAIEMRGSGRLQRLDRPVLDVAGGDRELSRHRAVVRDARGRRGDDLLHELPDPLPGAAGRQELDEDGPLRRPRRGRERRPAPAARSARGRRRRQSRRHREDPRRPDDPLPGDDRRRGDRPPRLRTWDRDPFGRVDRLGGIRAPEHGDRTGGGVGGESFEVRMDVYGIGSNPDIAIPPEAAVHDGSELLDQLEGLQELSR